MKDCRPRLIFGLLFSALVAVSCADAADPPPASEPSDQVAPEVQPVVREILGQVDDPPGAPGRRLTLVRYTIAPGAELAPHIHPGVQMASMVSGVLSYQVTSGTVTIHRQVDATGQPALIELLEGPTETELRAGDTVVEGATMVHFGSNRTTEPIVILATLITDPAGDLSAPAPLVP